MARKRAPVPTRPRGGVKTNTLYGPQFGRKDPARVEAGKKAAATRAAKKAQTPNTPIRGRSPSSSVPVPKAKNPKRVEAGKKAAATRAANKQRQQRKAKAMPTDAERFERARQKFNRDFAKANKAPRGSYTWEANMGALARKWHVEPPYGPDQVRAGIWQTLSAQYDKKQRRGA